MRSSMLINKLMPILLFSLLTFGLCSQIALSQDLERAPIETPPKPTSVGEATSRYWSGVDTLAASQGISRQEALDIFRAYWYESLQDGDPSPSVFNAFEVEGLKQLGVFLDNINPCEYVILPAGKTFDDFRQTPELFMLPECRPY